MDLLKRSREAMTHSALLPDEHRLEYLVDSLEKRIFRNDFLGVFIFVSSMLNQCRQCKCMIIMYAAFFFTIDKGI